MRRSKILEVIRGGGVALITNTSFTNSWRACTMISLATGTPRRRSTVRGSSSKVL